jgi:SpoIID/LytB domain protein
MKNPTKITVGIMDQQSEVAGRLNGNFQVDAIGPLSGRFSASLDAGGIVLSDEAGRKIQGLPFVMLTAQGKSTFSLSNVTIGNRFHWERREDQTFQGNLILRPAKGGTICAINEIALEEYLESVISSEMNAEAPKEFLKAHGMISRSWLLASLNRKKKPAERSNTEAKTVNEEIIRWYDREDHDLFDVCADDHCQRYQGVTKIISSQVEDAVRETSGRVIAFRNEICDTRYFKCCGGLTEEFATAWNDQRVPYLQSIPDAPVPHDPIGTEEEASAWILSTPGAYCRTQDEDLLRKILPSFDRETKDFFRWKVEYSRQELEEILLEKSGLDFGTLQEIIPLRRGPSGRISRVKIVGAKRSMVVGKELEIRRWLSRTHLFSSAFVVTADAGRFTFHGAGWGHGVGLCQIGAAVMAAQGFSAEEILKHYFRGVEIKKIY